MFTFLQKCARIILVLLAASLILSLPVFAFQNEPDGFRGIRWGANIGELSEMRLFDDGRGEDKMYTRKNDKMQIGDSDLKNIFYYFYKDRFYKVVVEYSSYSNFFKLKETLFQLYGSGDRPNRFIEEYFWSGSSLTVFLLFREIGKEGNIFYIYDPIFKELQRDREEKAKKGASDL